MDHGHVFHGFAVKLLQCSAFQASTNSSFAYWDFKRRQTTPDFLAECHVRFLQVHRNLEDFVHREAESSHYVYKCTYVYVRQLASRKHAKRKEGPKLSASREDRSPTR